MKLILVIPGVPIAQPRAKATGFGGHTRMYTPTSNKDKDGKKRSNGVAEFKALIAKIAGEQWEGKPPMSGPLRVDCVFVFPRLKGMMWKTKPMVRLLKVTKPDRDNLDKMVLDSLTGIAFNDDNQASCGMITKWHASGTEHAHTTIVIRQMTPEGNEVTAADTREES